MLRFKAGINYKFVSGVSEASEVSKYSREPAEDESLAQKSQNPIADLVSVPFQSNTNFNAGPFNRAQEILNIQPVVPLHLSDDWTVISRTIVPLTSQPRPLFDSNTNGVGDITQSLFLTPAHPGPLVWGIGPVFTVPSASDPILGTGRVLFGPTAVLVTTPGHWVMGVLHATAPLAFVVPSYVVALSFYALPVKPSIASSGWPSGSMPRAKSCAPRTALKLILRCAMSWQAGPSSLGRSNGSA